MKTDSSLSAMESLEDRTLLSVSLPTGGRIVSGATLAARAGSTAIIQPVSVVTPVTVGRVVSGRTLAGRSAGTGSIVTVPPVTTVRIVSGRTLAARAAAATSSATQTQIGVQPIDEPLQNVGISDVGASGDGMLGNLNGILPVGTETTLSGSSKATIGSATTGVIGINTTGSTIGAQGSIIGVPATFTEPSITGAFPFNITVGLPGTM